MRMCTQCVSHSLPRLPASSLISEKLVKSEPLYPPRNVDAEKHIQIDRKRVGGICFLIRNARTDSHGTCFLSEVFLVV